MSRRGSLINFLSCLVITLIIMANAHAKSTAIDIIIDGVLDDGGWNKTAKITENY